MSGVGAPPRPDLPLFVYGALQPGELGHHQLLAVQSGLPSAAATLPGHEIRMKDGLPLLASGRGIVRGHVLQLDREAYAVAGAYEPKDLYKWATVEAVVDEGVLPANALMIRDGIGGTEPDTIHQWTGAADPLFGPGVQALGDLALGALRRLRRPPAPSDPDFWMRFLAIQGLYLTTWTVAERLSTLAFGPDLGPMRRIEALGAWKPTLLALESADPPAIAVHLSTDRGRPLSSDDPSQALSAWYRARSNLSHRGKAAMLDARLVADCLIGLHDTLRLVLADQVPGLAEVWRATPGRLAEPWLLREALRR